jgi:hypothetical protein
VTAANLAERGQIGILGQRLMAHFNLDVSILPSGPTLGLLRIFGESRARNCDAMRYGVFRLFMSGGRAWPASLSFRTQPK